MPILVLQQYVKNQFRSWSVTIFDNWSLFKQAGYRVEVYGGTVHISDMPVGTKIYCYLCRDGC